MTGMPFVRHWWMRATGLLQIYWPSHMMIFVLVCLHLACVLLCMQELTFENWASRAM
jgi:hypothetical protein